MDVTEKMIKPLTETRYLTAENVDRYRVIVRLFYEKYEKMKYWLYQEEVWNEMRALPRFSFYTMEMCQQDLASLTAWGNLDTIQDTRHAGTIEEFKNKKYSYQLTQTAVEIERMVIRLENIQYEGSSLEPTLLERIASAVSEIPEIAVMDPERVSGWWKNFQQDFKRLNQNYMDYMHELNSVKAENMMQTEAFMLFKDRMIEYLRSFIKSLQRVIPVIEKRLSELDRSALNQILESVVQYEKTVPRFEEVFDENQFRENINGQWQNFEEWFLRSDEADSQVSVLFETTNEMIRKMTRYAARISEQSNAGANRREEYLKLAQIFGQCATIEEAHRLSACVFGIEKPFHIKGNFARETDSINSGVYDEPAGMVTVQPRTRTFRGRSSRTTVADHSRAKKETREAVLLQIAEEETLLQSFITGNKLVFEELGKNGSLTPEIRDRFLTWLARGLEGNETIAKTEDGKLYHIEKPEKAKRCILHCTDGDFDMPAYVIVFED